jgi:hypothetical protein
MAANVIKEIASVKSFVRARTGLDADGVSDTLMSSFVATIVKMINATASFSTLDAGHVTDAIADRPYGASTGQVVAAIEARLKASQAIVSVKDPIGGASQFIKCWWDFGLQSDWDFIRNPKHSWNSKMTRMVERGMSLGVNHPDEQSLKWLLALLLVVCYDELPAYKEIFAKLHDLKQAFVAERKAYPLAHVAVYPETPIELSADMFKYAYGDEHPVTVKLIGINNVAENHIPLRKNSKLLKRMHKKVDIDDWESLKDEVHGSARPAIRIVSDGSCSVAHTGLIAPKVEPDLGSCNEEDAEEKALLLEYQAKLLRARQARTVRVSNPAESTGVLTTAMSHRIDEQRNGLRLIPRVQKTEGDDTPGACLLAPKHESFIKREVVKEETAFDDGDITQLDAHSQAAIKAMQQRNGKKKESDKQKQADTRAAATQAKEATIAGVLKRPATAVDATVVAKKIKVEGGMKRPAAAVKAEVVEVPKSKILSAMPALNKDGSSPDPVFYNGGVIYTAVNGKKFRALKERGDNYTEKSKVWGQDTPSKASWSTVVEAIDAHKKGKK